MPLQTGYGHRAARVHARRGSTQISGPHWRRRPRPCARAETQRPIPASPRPRTRRTPCTHGLACAECSVVFCPPARLYDVVEDARNRENRQPLAGQHVARQLRLDGVLHVLPQEDPSRTVLPPRGSTCGWRHTPPYGGAAQGAIVNARDVGDVLRTKDPLPQGGEIPSEQAAGATRASSTISSCCARYPTSARQEMGVVVLDHAGRVHAFPGIADRCRHQPAGQDRHNEEKQSVPDRKISDRHVVGFPPGHDVALRHAPFRLPAGRQTTGRDRRPLTTRPILRAMRIWQHRTRINGVLRRWIGC